MKARLDARLSRIERRLKPARWVHVIDSDELEAAGYYLVSTDEELTSDERYYVSILPLAGGIPDPLPPGLIKVKRDELDDVMARMNARPWIVRSFDPMQAECGVSLRELEIQAHGEQRVREMEAEAQQRWREICEGLWEARRQREQAENAVNGL
jgi:hypothetical protein